MQDQRGNRPFPDQTSNRKDLKQDSISTRLNATNNHDRFFTAKQRKLQDPFEWR